MNRLGIYIHWPYCISKCPYCDFNSHAIKNYDPNEWLSAYENQIKYFKEYLSFVARSPSYHSSICESRKHNFG